MFLKKCYLANVLADIFTIVPIALALPHTLVIKCTLVNVTQIPFIL